ncbi:MAG: MTH938/NDUFAF3 family protein [Desulfobacterales bacterium]
MIEKYSSGRIIVNNITYHRDLKIIQGQVVDNWWRKTGHQVDINDMKDVLGASPDIIVIGTGYAENMLVSKELTSETRQRDIKLIAENTNKAVQTFNDLFSKGKNVSGAFHLTC